MAKKGVKKDYLSDKNQVIKLIFYSISEIFKIVMATMLVIFVPQKCGDDLCTMSQIMNSYDIYRNGELLTQYSKWPTPRRWEPHPVASAVSRATA